MSYIIGVDTGTTSISIVAMNEDVELIDRLTINHGSFIPGEFEHSRVQDPERIKSLVDEVLADIITKYGRPSGIGFTGQMHGMLYVDAKGDSVSPLYTWQDGSGNDSVALLREHGLRVSPGYGLATHYFLQRAGKIPDSARKMTTISDYIAMKLCGNHEPVISSDMAASWGCFDIQEREFMCAKLQSVGVDISYLPETRKSYEVIGHTLQGVPVISSLGDNQASVMGSVSDGENSVLINVGTGAQVSTITSKYFPAEGDIEIRPYDDKYLLAGSSLCGGRAYAMLEKFYREISGHEYYSVMMSQAEEFMKSGGHAWDVTTTFMGTRSDSAKTGSITGITEENFCAGAFTVGVIQGILRELHGFYSSMKDLTGKTARVLVGSGNGLRRNEIMKVLAQNIFCMKINIPVWQEEAACGAALCAMARTGLAESITEAQKLICY